MRFYYSSKREQYYDKAMQLYFEEGMCGTHICKVLPISRRALYNWIAIFAEQNPQIASMKGVKKVKKVSKPSPESQAEELPKSVLELQAELKRLRAQLKKAEIKAEGTCTRRTPNDMRFNIFASCLAYRSRHITNTMNQRFWPVRPERLLPWSTSRKSG